MKVTKLELDGLILIERPVFHDARGFFMERFQLEQFGKHGLPTAFFQDNHSRSLPRVLRGLHYQHGPDQGRLIGVVRGAIWDLVVDIRHDSPTFGRSFGIEINDANGLLLWIPPGLAHGFCVQGDEPADLVYKVDAPYVPASEGGIRWDDPDLNIPWPIRDPIVSERDASLESFSDYKKRSLHWQVKR